MKERLQSRLKEAKQIGNIPEREEQAKNNNAAASPPIHTGEEHVQDAANETSFWKGDSDVDDNASSYAVIPGVARGNGNNKIAKVVTEMEPESGISYVDKESQFETHIVVW